MAQYATLILTVGLIRFGYASQDYQRVLKTHRITCGMSRRGNCHDNAPAESWFSTLKLELGADFESNAAAKTALFDYIEIFYNQRRRHSALAYMEGVRNFV